MKQALKRILLTLLVAAFIAPASLLAQREEKEKKEKEMKEKEVKEKREAEQIIITRKGDNDEKIVVEVTGDKIIVNGKEIKEDKDGDVTVRRHKIKDVWAYGGGIPIQAQGRVVEILKCLKWMRTGLCWVSLRNKLTMASKYKL